MGEIMKNNIKLKSLRVSLGLTQKQISKRLRITQGAVSHWERGLSYPSVNVAGKLVKIANKRGIYCTIEDLRKA